jgi:hypothetical protein
MAMNVSSSTNSAKLQQAPQQNQAQRSAPKPKAAEQPKQAEQAQKPEQPRPVVNSQGQVTGKRINITA